MLLNARQQMETAGAAIPAPYRQYRSLAEFVEVIGGTR